MILIFSFLLQVQANYYIILIINLVFAPKVITMVSTIKESLLKQ